MARKKGYILMVDTETANTIQEGSKLNMDSVLPYDLGISLLDWATLTEVENHSLVISDIYDGEKDLMQTAYYADKLPMYEEQLRKGERVKVTAYEAKQIIQNLCNNYNVVAMVAHNARFDAKALNNLTRWTTKSKYRYFLPYGVEVWDTLKMARQVMGKMPTYKKFCNEHGYITKNNQLRFTAEILYQFITDNTDFQEAHTGLEDVKIETEILRYIKRQHKKMVKQLWT